MQQPSSQVNPLSVADYRASYNNPTPYCGNSCGTGFTVGSGFMSGTGVFTFTSGAEIPVGVLEDEEVGLVLSVDNNASVDPNATLAGVSFTDNGFTLTTSTGVYTPNGFTPFGTTTVPEPDLWILCVVGTVGISVLGKLRAGRPGCR
jgi:hypothetical protein